MVIFGKNILVAHYVSVTLFVIEVICSVFYIFTSSQEGFCSFPIYFQKLIGVVLSAERVISFYVFRRPAIVRFIARLSFLDMPMSVEIHVVAVDL